MFTGIVQEVGYVLAADVHGTDARLRIGAATVLDGLVPGASVAVDGVCLTATAVADDSFTVDVMPETLRRTTLGGLTAGSAVNLERAMRVDGRFDGHIVQGHVDGVGRLVTRRPGERWDDLEFAAAPEVLRYIAEKGSVTLNGVSLTVTGVHAGGFGVSLIPTTLAATNLGALAAGAPVNIEVDVLAKYVERLMTARASAADGRIA